MTPVLTLLNTLRQNQIHVSLDGDRLRVRGPIDRLTEALKAELAQSKPQLIDALRRLRHESAALPILRKVEHRSEPLPLGPYQKRFWFFDQLQPGSTRYIRVIQIHVDAPFDRDAYVDCLNEFVRRHEILRTVFPTRNGQPVQHILPSFALDVPLVDLSHLPSSEWQATLASLSSSDARQRFDLAVEPGIRASIFRLPNEKHILSVALHHIVYDAWSIGILFREVGTLYQAHSTGSPPTLPELAVQYADFTEWQNRALRGAPLDALLERARSQLHGAPPVFVWPTAKPRPGIQTFRGATLRMSLPHGLTNAVYRLSQESGYTPFVILMAAFNALLYRHSGQTDFCVGTLSANRNRLEIEPLMGNFVNILPLRCKVSSSDTFPNLLRLTHRQMSDARTYHDLPFEALIEQPFVQRDPAYSPIFQVMFSMENENIGGNRDRSGDGWYLRTLPESTRDHSTYARFDLTVTVQEMDRQLELAFEYNVDLLDRATVEGLMRAYPILLADGMARPRAVIGELATLSEQERQRLLIEWNDTAAPHDEQRLLHRLFEEQAAATPQRLALTFDSTSLTYAELNARANQVAHYLRAEAGVEPDSLVAIYCETSVELVVGILGTLKAGGAYLPLDPAYPRERLEWMIDDARPVAILTHRRTASASLLPSAPTLCLDADADKLASYSVADSAGAVDPGNLAYVIYTSGSTGHPKGIAVSHAAAANFIHGIVRGLYQGLPGEDAPRVGVNASFSFDGSLKQFLLLLFGCPLFLIPAEIRADPHRLLAFLKERQIDVVNCTPSQLRTLLDEDDGDMLCSRVIVGGEAIDPALWQRMQSFPNRRFCNVYGPTECAAVSTSCSVDADTAAPAIGRPLENVRIYILDERLDPVPVGTPGEIFIGGAGVARGYLGKPGLTAERFIPDPFGATPAGRLFRTGDLACYLADGNIAFIGRADHQVKLRGYRVELDEIAAVLKRQDGVSDATVLMRDDTTAGPELIGYVSLKPGASIAAAELRARLQSSLPDYMLPTRIELLDRLPLTPSGKVDRAALPVARPHADAQVRNDAAHTPMENLLLRLWRETLGVEQIGVHDKFFDLGGHSFRALLLLAAVKRATGIALPVAAIFSHPTIAKQAALMAQSKPTSRGLLVPLATHPTAPPLFCVHTVGGQVFSYRDLALQLHGRSSVHGLQSPEVAGMPGRAKSLDALALRYAAEITAAQSSGPYRLLGWSAGARIALAVAAALERQGHTVGYLGLVDPRLSEPAEESASEEALIARSLFALSGGRLRAADLSEFKFTLGTPKREHLLAYLRKWDSSATSALLPMARRELALIFRHFRMLEAGGTPAPLRTVLHVYWAEHSPNQLDAEAFDWTGLTSHPAGNVAATLRCGHFDMLKTPHVERLADAVAQHIAAASACAS